MIRAGCRPRSIVGRRSETPGPRFAFCAALGLAWASGAAPASAEELYLAANPSDAAELTLVGVADGTTYALVDLDDATEVESGTVDRFQVTTTDVATIQHLLVRTSHPVLVYLGHDCCGVGGSTFVPTEGGHSAIGRAFVLYLPVFSTQSDLFLFAQEDARVVVTDADGRLVAQRSLEAGGVWLVYPIVGARPYSVRSTGDVSIMLSAVNGLTAVPPALREAACDGDVGREFYLASHSWGTGAVAVFAYERSHVTIEPTSGGLPVADSDVEPGAWFFVNELYRHSYHVVSTGDVAVWTGDMEGGASIGDIGDDFSVDLGRGGLDVIVHSQNHGATVLAPYDGTTIAIDGEEHTLDGGQWVAIDAGLTVRIGSDQPVVTMTYGGNVLNDWGGFLRPAPPLTPEADPCPDVDADIPEFPDAGPDSDVETPADADVVDADTADGPVDAGSPGGDADGPPAPTTTPRATCDCRAADARLPGLRALFAALSHAFVSSWPSGR